jgi:WhiB family redox-sensing transcriptional regulator
VSTYHPNHHPISHATPPVAALPDRACAGIGPEIFYSTTGGKPVEALDLCGICPHADPCLEWALETRQDHGIWGATTPEQRVTLLRRRGTENT